MSMRTGRAKWAARGAALALGLAFAAVAGEVAYRLLRVADLSPTTNPSYVEHDEELGWRYRSNARERHRTAEFDVAIETNARGFRGPEWPQSDAAKSTVLVLGDSFAFGWGVAWEDGLVARLAAQRPRLRVLGAGVSGYGTDQEFLLLRRLRAEVAPRAVVCVFCANDLWEASAREAYGRSKPFVRVANGEVAVEGVPVPRSWLERTSALWCAVQKQLWQQRFAARVRDADAEWAQVLGLLRAMRDLAAPAPLVLVGYEERLARFAAGEPGIEFVDAGQLVRDLPGSGCYPIDGHWTAAGHAAVATGLAQVLDEVLR